MSYVKPDVMYRVPIQDGELQVSPSHDFLHRFEAIGAWLFKYHNVDIDPPAICNIPLTDEAAEFLIKSCGVEVCNRTFIGETEHEHWLDWKANEIQDLDFGLEAGE